MSPMIFLDQNWTSPSHTQTSAWDELHLLLVQQCPTILAKCYQCKTLFQSKFQIEILRSFRLPKVKIFFPSITSKLTTGEWERLHHFHLRVRVDGMVYNIQIEICLFLWKNYVNIAIWNKVFLKLFRKMM